MSKRSLLIIVISLFLFPVKPLLAKDVSLQWEDLAPLVAGREVEFVLPDGTKLKGDVYAVQQDSLVLDVKKTSNKALYPKGQQAIERALISSINLRNKTIRWRVIATIAGAVVGVFAGGYVACLTGSVPLGLSVMTGLPIGLHVATRPADVQVTRIEIKPPGTADVQAPEEE